MDAPSRDAQTDSRSSIFASNRIRVLATVLASRLLLVVTTVLFQSLDCVAAEMTGVADWLRRAVEEAQIIKAEGARYAAIDQVFKVELQAGLLTIDQAKLKANALTPEYSRVRCLTEVGVTQARTGDATGAVTTAELIDDRDSRSSALVRIALADVERGNLKAARLTTELVASLHRELIRTDSRVVKKYLAVPYIEIAEAQARNGDAEGARMTLKVSPGPTGVEHYLRRWAGLNIAAGADDPLDALTAAGYQQDEADYVLYDLVGKRVVENNNAGAQKVATLIQAAWFRSNAYSTITLHQFRQGDLENGRVTLTLAEAAQAQERDTDHRKWCDGKLTIAYAAAGDVKKSRAMAHASDSELYGKRKIRQMNVEGELVSALCRQKRLADAKALAVEFDGEVIGGQICRELGRAHIALGKTDDLTKWVQSLKNPIDRTWTYIGAAEALINPIHKGQ